MKYIALYETTIQTGPDDWSKSTPAMEINDNTTIGQIKEWLLKRERITEERFKVSAYEIKIIKLES